MEIVFLGTSAMVPTKERNHSAILLSYGSEGILVDCGEATQRQLKIAGIKSSKISKIIITHWHGDHALGLPGLLQTLSSTEPGKTIEIFGPKGTKGFMALLLKSFIFENQLNLKIKEIDDGELCNNKEFKIDVYQLNHGIPCIGVVFTEKDKKRIKTAFVKKIGIPDGPLLGKLQEGKVVEWKGKKVAPKDATFSVVGKKVGIISDTALCNNCYAIAKGVDLLIAESTYSGKLEEKATEHNHLTSAQAALVASKSESKKLVLTHFSQRYKTTEELEEDAKTYFDNVICAYDFLKIKI